MGDVLNVECTQFTCFTRTKAQILAQKALLAQKTKNACGLCGRSAQCRMYTVYLLCSYKSTNTGAEGAASLLDIRFSTGKTPLIYSTNVQILTHKALVQKYKY